jgi:hypothetical protein
MAAPEDMKAAITDIINSTSLDDLTMQILRERLQVHYYSQDMLPHKTLIKQLLTEVSRSRM